MATKRKRPADPTRTIGVTKRWAGQSNKRFRSLKGAINRLLLKDDDGTTAQFIGNAFVFTNDAQSITEFMAWLEGQIAEKVVGPGATADDNWQNKFVNQSYDRGFKRAQADMKKAKILPRFSPGVAPAPIVGTATPSLAVSIGAPIELLGTAAAPIHLDTIQTLYVREFQALKGVTDEMAKQIARALVEGVEQGQGIREIAKNVTDRVDKIGISRAKTIARTETSKAFNSAVIAEGETVSGALGIEVLYKWITAGDDRVRDSHVLRNNKEFTAEEAARLIGEPNCRCALRIVQAENSERKAA